MLKTVMLRSALIAFTCALSVAAHAYAADPQRIDVPAGDLTAALEALAKQSGVELVYQTDQLKGLRTQGVTGNFSPEEAVTKLLQGTKLTLRTDTSGAMLIALPRASSNPETAAPGSDSSRTPSPPQAFNSETSNADTAKKAGFWARFRLAQNESASQADKSSSIEERPSQSSDKNSEGRVIEEVVVTGTHIRATAPVGSEVIVIDRAEIERSGYGTVHDVIGSLPQNYVGVGEEFTSGREVGTNTTDGNAPNLRGLGSGATLVLINGRRTAPTGSEGIYTDLSYIPLSAVDRIEVLLDGASAIYGSAAVGGVVNVILRKDYRGAETRLRAGTVTEGDAQEYQFAQSLGAGWGTGQGLLSYEFYKREALGREERALSADCDLRRFSGDNFCNIFSNPGTILAGGQTYAIPRGQDGTSLTPADFTAGTVNLDNRNEVQDLLPLQQRHSISGFVSQSVGDRLTLEGTVLFSTREASGRTAAAISPLFVTSSNPFYVNPTGGTGPILIPYSFRADFGPQTRDTDIETYSAALTGKLKATETWLLTTDVGYSREKHDRINAGLLNRGALNVALNDPNPATAFNPFGDGSHTNPGTLDAIRGDVSFSGDSDLWTVQMAAEGPVARLPGGEMRLAVGAEYDRQEFSGTGREITGALFGTQYDREVSAAYAELLIPLLGSGNRRSGANRLELSLAGRYEEYGDYGDTINPKFGVKWSPVEGLAFRGSWGTSFKAPNVLDVDETLNLSFIFPIDDPASPSGFSDALIWEGGNADLKEETATIFNLGVEISPPSAPNLRIGLTYFDIDFKDRIEPVIDPFSALLDPAFADIVTRDPTAAQREMVCSRSTFDGDPNDCLNAPIAALVDGRIGNSSVVRNRGVDFLGSYGLESGIGTFNFNLNATYLIEFARALRETSALLEILDTPFNPLDFRLRGSASWARGGLEATAYVNYTDSYVDTVSEPDRKIDSWTTLDLAVSYQLPLQGNSVLSDFVLSLNVQNLLDEDPPFFNNPAGVGYDAVNASLLGRFVSFQVRMGWGGGQAR